MNCKLTKRFGFAAFIIGLTLCGVGLRLLLSPAEYQTTTRIKPEHEAEPGVFSGPYFIQTEFEVIWSDLLLGRVVEALNLNVEWGKKYAGGKRLKTSETVGLLRRRVNLRLSNNTTFIDITVTDENPVGASKIANTIAETYRKFRLEQRQQRQQKVATSEVEIVNPAAPPKCPISQNRLFGTAFVFCGLAGVVSGFYLLSFRDSAAKTNL